MTGLIQEKDSAVRYMIDEITHICRDMGKRSPGSKGERTAGEYMADQLRLDCGCQRVQIETFPEHPGAFYGYLYYAVALDFLCVASFLVSPWLSAVFALASILLTLFEFFLYRKPIDPLFPKREGINVTAVKACTGEVKRRVFLNGHLDAAWEWPVNYHWGGIAFETHAVIAIIGIVYYLCIAICTGLGAGAWTKTAVWIGFLFMPFWIGMLFMRDRKRVVDGANDNLTGCYIGISVLKALQEKGIELEHTEVGVILTGSEEAGLRGAKAWCKAHRPDASGVPTYIYTFDTIHDPQYLMANYRDLNGIVKADRPMAELFIESAAELGISCRKGWVPPLGGATDSAAFLQGGYRSVSITGLNHKLEDYYHTRRDTYDNLNPDGLADCYAATINLIEKIDQGILEL